MSAAPALTSSTASVPMISKGTVGFSSRHFGSCGTSHLLANALGLVTRSGACTSSSANNAPRRGQLPLILISHPTLPPHRRPIVAPHFFLPSRRQRANSPHVR